ncbi:MAG: hypothetical protein CW338_07560 [Clostridiales bacterium]|nr:hypothetical protein [Clostridiales bacterium]
MKYCLSPGLFIRRCSDGRFSVTDGKDICARISNADCGLLLDGPDDACPEGRDLISRMALLLQPGTEEPQMQFCSYVRRGAAQISITAACNCRCLHCMASDRSGKMSGTFSPEQFAYILDQCRSVGIRNIDLTGGEPLMHPRFMELVRAVTDRKMKLTAVQTNGSLLTADILSGLKALGQEPVIDVSFDGLGTHDIMRGVPGMEEKALHAMDLVRAAGFPLRCNINVNRLTLPRLAETARFLATQKGAGLFLIMTQPTPRWKENDRGLDLSVSEFYDAGLDVLEAALKERWPGSIHILFMPQVPENRDMSRIFDIWHRRESVPLSMPCYSNCPKACEMIYISHDGRVLPCSALEGYSLEQGMMTGDDVNILKTPLSRILTGSDYMKPFRVTLKDLIAKSPKCGKCPWLPVCRGGCRPGTLQKDMDTACEANCLFFTGGYAERFEKLLT